MTRSAFVGVFSPTDIMAGGRMASTFRLSRTASRGWQAFACHDGIRYRAYAVDDCAYAVEDCAYAVRDRAYAVGDCAYAVADWASVKSRLLSGP